MFVLIHNYHDIVLVDTGVVDVDVVDTAVDTAVHAAVDIAVDTAVHAVVDAVVDAAADNIDYEDDIHTGQSHCSLHCIVQVEV